ncbi:maleylpyruvate isomerase N-terminal domain-containing protein [Streptomyces sp. NPDC059355]|uniref:maleylpyruvate isomerase N-terminal domain-containing protein n=1 Tax=Streptomyces sp. NPDC059355 TaxID=3346811 RepID=UPI003686BD05
MELFSCSWEALPGAVDAVADADFGRESGCRGWLVRDLVCHLAIDAQDVLITLVTPAAGEATADAATYRNVADRPPDGEDPLDALLTGTGRRAPTPSEQEEPGALAGRLPFAFG